MELLGPTPAVRARVRRRGLPVLVALLAGLAVAGCSPGGAGGPTQGQYVAAADEVCTRHDEAIDEIEAEQVTDPDPARTERWVRAELVPEYKDMSAALRAIPPPEDDGVYLRGLYEDLDHAIGVLHLRPSEGRTLVSEDEDLRRRFSSYGMKVCGRV